MAGLASRFGCEPRACGVVVLTALLVTIAGCSSTAIEASRNVLPASVPNVPTGTELATAKTAFESGNFGYAARYFEKAAEGSPESMEACLGLAASYDWLYRFDLSDRAYGTCREIDGESFSYHNNMGFSRLLRGEYGKASVSFARANALQPNHPVVKTNLRILRDASSG